MTVKLFDQDGHLLCEGKRSASIESIKVWAPSPQNNEELYTFRDIRVELGVGVVLVSWIDDTDRNPRKSIPANVKHTVEVALPGGAVGPFVVTTD